MRYTVLGNSDLHVSVLGLGCSGMSQNYSPQSDAESTAAIRLAVERGINFFDTSDAYGNGHNETLLAAALMGLGDSVVIATKFGNMRGPGGERLGFNARPEYVPRACEASLKRLGRETIDLYYLHRVDPQVPIEETVAAMARLVEQGKVRYLGLSEAKPDIIRRAHAVHPITALESEYSLWTREPEKELLPLCSELGITYVAYAPLGRGFLSAAVKSPQNLPATDRRHQHPRFQKENLKRNVALLEPLERLAEKKRCRPVQIALAWILSRGFDLVPIPGTRNRAHLEENIAALDVELKPAELELLSAAFCTGAAWGTRYPAKQMLNMGF
ncbi:MAG: aldo/keto reductase [Thermodesulfobacteriota bacterium]